MKLLTLVRHADTAGAAPDQSDFDRPLTTKGRDAAIAAGQSFKIKNHHFSIMYCSAATRALETAQLISEAMDYPIKEVIPEITLYTFEENQLLDFISSLHNSLHHVAIVCHNPAITDAVKTLSSQPTRHMSTCGVAHMKVELNDWTDLFIRKHKVLYQT